MAETPILLSLPSINHRRMDHCGKPATACTMIDDPIGIGFTCASQINLDRNGTANVKFKSQNVMLSSLHLILMHQF